MGSLAALLLEHPFGSDDDLLYTIDRVVTAGQAREAAKALARRVVLAGVQPGGPVAVRLPDGPDAVVAMAGIWAAGAVFVPVNPKAPAPERDRIIAATGAAALLDDLTEPSGLRPLPGPHRCYEPDTAFVTWTSGTTGAPKAILHTHDGYLELLDRVLGSLRGRSGGVPKQPVDGMTKRPVPNLIPMSLAINSGIYNALFGLRAGAALVIMERFATREFAELVRRFGIRSTVLPPAAIAMLNDDPAVPDLGHLRYVRSITAPLSPVQARRFTERFGAFVLNGYGQAEIGEVIGWTAAEAKAHPEKLGAVGRPHPGVETRIVDDAGADVAPGVVGELLVRPPRMAEGYATGEDLGGRIDAQGYLRTGDIARIDNDGFVWIEGRVGDVINRGGNKVFPEHVEEVLCMSPSVVEAAVVGVPDQRLGELPVAFVVDAGAEPATDAELTGLCRAHLVAYKVPAAFYHVPALPRTEVGKIRRAELAATLGTGATRPPHSPHG